MEALSPKTVAELARAFPSLLGCAIGFQTRSIVDKVPRKLFIIKPAETDKDVKHDIWTERRRSLNLLEDIMESKPVDTHFPVGRQLYDSLPLVAFTIEANAHEQAEAISRLFEIIDSRFNPEWADKLKEKYNALQCRD
jgi:hypothetical protein